MYLVCLHAQVAHALAHARLPPTQVCRLRHGSWPMSIQLLVPMRPCAMQRLEDAKRTVLPVLMRLLAHTSLDSLVPNMLAPLLLDRWGPGRGAGTPLRRRTMPIQMEEMG